ncbi:MAG TPA: hypothetical protein VF199_03735 [Bacillales bacterium]
MKSFLFYLLMLLLAIVFALFLLGYLKLAFGIGAFLIFLLLGIGQYYSMKNREYIIKKGKTNKKER